MRFLASSENANRARSTPFFRMRTGFPQRAGTNFASAASFEHAQNSSAVRRRTSEPSVRSTTFFRVTFSTPQWECTRTRFTPHRRAQTAKMQRMEMLPECTCTTSYGRDRRTFMSGLTMPKRLPPGLKVSPSSSTVPPQDAAASRYASLSQ